MTAIFQSPKTVVLGEGALRTSSKYMIDYGKKALIVCDEFVAKTKVMVELKEFLETCAISYFEYAQTASEPTDASVAAGRKLFDYSECDFIIALGGGSVIDGAKAIAIPEGRPLSYYRNKEITGTLPKIVAVPTTAGNGSEATRFAIVTDTLTNTKMILKGDCLLPELVVIDPRYSMGVRRDVVIASGIEALIGAIESFLSAKANAISKMYATKAIVAVFANLPKMADDEVNVEYRENLAMASYYTGMALNNSSFALVNSMAWQIGTMYDLPHSVASSLVMESCLRYLDKELKGDFEYLARLIDCQDFLGEIGRLFDYCGLDRYNEFNIDETRIMADVAKMAYDALIMGNTSNQKVPVSKEILMNIYYNSLKSS